MEFNIPGINSTRQSVSTGVGSTSGTSEPEFLFDDETVDGVNENKPAGAANGNEDLRAKLAELEAQRQAKLLEKQELIKQKNSIQKRRAQIEAQIKANEEAIKVNNAVIIENQEKIEIQQKQIEQLQQQYDEKCKEAEALNERINERIAQILEKSEQDVQEATEKVRKATEEAYAKVASGELKEEEVAQYVSDRAGISGLAASSADFADINAMNNQMKNIVTSAKSLSNQMIAASELIKGFQTNITSAINSNQELADKNKPLVQQLNEIKEEERLINSEIVRVDADIAKIDDEIAKISGQLATQPTTNSGKNAGTKAPNYEVSDKKVFEEATLKATTTTNTNSNPFLAISYNNASFSSTVDALDAMVKANEQTISNAQATVEANNEIIRNIFQEQMKK